MISTSIRRINDTIRPVSVTLCFLNNTHTHTHTHTHTRDHEALYTTDGQKERAWSYMSEYKLQGKKSKLAMPEGQDQTQDRSRQMFDDFCICWILHYLTLKAVPSPLRMTLLDFHVKVKAICSGQVKRLVASLSSETQSQG